MLSSNLSEVRKDRKGTLGFCLKKAEDVFNSFLFHMGGKDAIWLLMLEPLWDWRWRRVSEADTRSGEPRLQVAIHCLWAGTQLVSKLVSSTGTCLLWGEDASVESILGNKLCSVMKISPNIPHLFFPAFEPCKSLLFPLKLLGFV